jgi:O-antigen/teichoic acid export membrane protein
MRKILYVVYIIVGSISFLGCIQAMFQQDMKLLGLAAFSMFSSFIIAFIAERREDKKHDARCQSWGIGMLLLVTLAAGMLLLSSCSPSGYGCHGRSKCMTRVR